MKGRGLENGKRQRKEGGQSRTEREQKEEEKKKLARDTWGRERNGDESWGSLAVQFLYLAPT